MSSSSQYGKRFAKVRDYIDKHLSEDLSIERLSQVANFSKFHFHRQFSHYAGISVSRYIQMMRLKRASGRLVFEPHVQIIEIALEAGFENPELFSRAFKRAFDQTPSQFRIYPAWKPWGERYRFPIKEGTSNMDVKIVSFEETKVAVLEHRGPPEQVDDSAKTFIAWRKESKLSPVKTSKTYGIAYDDPDTAESRGLPVRYLRFRHHGGSGESAGGRKQNHPRRAVRRGPPSWRTRPDRRECLLPL